MVLEAPDRKGILYQIIFNNGLNMHYAFSLFAALIARVRHAVCDHRERDCADRYPYNPRDGCTLIPWCSTSHHMYGT